MSYLLGLQVSPTDKPALMPEAPAAMKPVKDPSKDPLAALFTAMPSPASDRAFGTQALKSALPTPGEPAGVDPSMTTGPTQDAPRGETDPATGLRLEGFKKVEGEQAVEVSLSKTSSAHAAKKYAASGPPVEKAPAAEPLPAEAEAVAASSRARTAPTGTKKPESGRSTSEASRLDGLASVTVASSASAADASAASGAPAASAATAAVSVPEVVQRVESLVQKGGGEMTVSLDPPDLGKLEIKVTARGNRVEVEMRSESLKAKSALESSLPDLKSAMQSHDLQLTKLDVQVHRDPQAFAHHSFAGWQGGDGRHAGGAQGERNQSQTRSLPESDRRLSAASVAQPIRSAPLVTGDGRIDRRV